MFEYNPMISNIITVGNIYISKIFCCAILMTINLFIITMAHIINKNLFSLVMQL